VVRFSRALAARGYPELSQEAPAAAGLVGDGDVYIGLSHSGTTPETVRVLGLARPRDALAAALTNTAPSPVANTAPSPVADTADAVLTTVVRQAGPCSGAMAGGVSQLTVVDGVLIAEGAEHPAPDRGSAAGDVRRRPRPAYGRTPRR
jgi:DNA-binding MurR/RpiR family transcriptional regulator